MPIKFRDNVEKMAGYVPGFQPDDPAAIKINTNENPYPPSPRVFDALKNLSALDLCRYPSSMWKSFRAAAARIYQVDEPMIACGNGGDELLAYLVRCCCDQNRPLAYPVPTYTLYPTLAEIQGCPVIEVPFNPDFSIPDQLARTDAPLTILCNPNAPSATFIEPAEIEKLARRLNGVLLVDEAYVDFAPDNCLDLARRLDNVVLLRSMSKSYSLAGMRFGYLIGAPAIIEAVVKIKDSYNVNVASQAAAVAALSDQDYVRQTIEKIKQQRQRLTLALRQLNFTVADSYTNFVLAAVPPDVQAPAVAQALARHNIYVRYFDIDGLRDKLRISIGTVQQMDCLIDTLKTILKQES